MKPRRGKKRSISPAPVPVAAPDQPHKLRWWRRHGLAALLPVFLTAMVSNARPTFEYSLKAPINPFDEGILLTLRRFAGFGFLPYKDLWTLYGPGESLLGPIISLISGRSLLAHRIVNILMLEGLVFLIYLLCSKFVSRWNASVFASIAGLIAAPIPYVMGLLFLFGGMYLAFILHESNAPDRLGSRRQMTGMVLIGCAFLGRIDFALLALWGVLVVMFCCWGSAIRRRSIPILSASCLAPGLVFLIYLAFIPMDTLIENFFTYPFKYYSQVQCRGLPVNWSATFRLLWEIPFRGMWNPFELTLVLGLLFLPGLGLALVAVSMLTKTLHWRPLLLFLGGTDLFMWHGLLRRQGANPTPALPLAILSLAVVCFVFNAWNIGLGKRIATVCALFLGFSVIPPFIPGALQSWTSWPPYDPIVGFNDPQTPTLLTPQLYRTMAQDVDRIAKPHEPIFVALERNAGTFASAAGLYWALDRPPASHFFEFDPCLTDREDIQQKMVRELARTRVVITHNFWQQRDFSNPPATSLDNYLHEHFREEKTYAAGPSGEHYKLLVRKS